MSTQLKMPEPEPAWKQKYYQALNEFDAREKRWSEEEGELYKSILRLVLSYSGDDPKLDNTLAGMRDKLRQETGSESRKKIITPVIDEIVRFKASRQDDQDAKSSAMVDADPLFSLLDGLSLPGEAGIEIMALRKRARSIQQEQERLQLIQDLVDLLTQGANNGEDQVAAAAGIAQFKNTLLELFEWLSIPPEYSNKVKQLQAQISSLQGEQDLSSTLRQTALVINDLQEALQVELGDIQMFLARVTDRLEDVEHSFQELMLSDDSSMKSTEKLNQQVEDNISRIRAGIASSDDVKTLKDTIESRLLFLEQSTTDYFNSMQAHRQVFDDRVKVLQGRLKQMKGESIKLHKRILEEYRKAKTDALTGIANRLAYNEKLKQELSRRQRNGGALSLCVIDVDKFKGVNDSFGHKAGDKVLQTIADVCSSNIREEDFFARYGGEEFVLLLPETCLQQASTVAENLRAQIEKRKFHYATEPVSITISCGLAEFGNEDSGETAFKRADKALYRAKEEGRNRVMLAD